MSFTPKKCFVIVGNNNSPSPPFLTAQEAEAQLAEWCVDMGITPEHAKDTNAARIEKAVLVPDEE